MPSLRVRGLGTVKLRGVRVRVGEEFERRGGTPRREIKVFERHKADDTFTPIGGLHPCPTHTHTHTNTRGSNPSPTHTRTHTHTHTRPESFPNTHPRLESFPNTHTHTHTASAAGRERARGPHHHRFGFRRSPTYLYKLSTFP